MLCAEVTVYITITLLSVTLISTLLIYIDHAHTIPIEMCFRTASNEIWSQEPRNIALSYGAKCVSISRTV